MTFDEVLTQVIDLLQRESRVAYRALRIRFDLDDDYIEALKDEIIEAKRLARDEDSRVLVWVGEPRTTPASSPTRAQDHEPTSSTSSPPLVESSTSPTALTGERRQVTILFADISGFTALAETIDPEAIRDLMNACFTQLVPIIEKYGGTVDKFIGDEIMALFGAPVAHENDAEGAVRTALEMMEILTTFNAEQGTDLGLHCGINTGLVIAGGIGTGARQDYSVMGDAVNVAARLQDVSERGQILIGPETYQLTQTMFTCESLEPFRVRGKAELVQAYRVFMLREVPPDLDDIGPRGMTPLIGRDGEVILLGQRWEQVKDGEGQVVLLNGEVGVGKSRLIQALKEHVAADTHLRLECHCSPYHTNSALYPVVDLLERVMRFARNDSSDQKLEKLEGVLRQYRLGLEEIVPLLAALLSFPLAAERYPPLTLSLQLQKQRTLEVVLAILLDLASRQPVLFIVEDLHWIDPSTIELLHLLVEQGPTARIYTLFTCRPNFVSPWTSHPDLTQITLSRLPHAQMEHIIVGVTGAKALPAEVVQQIVSKTDGIPLFVEELTKMVLESGLLRDLGDRYELVGSLPSLAIPTTLQASLMARLDRLGTSKTVAQLGATIGRQFSYELH